MHRLEGAFFTHQDLDITVRDDVHACVASIRPDVIINAAAYTAVDQAESEKQKAMKVNAEGPANLARAAARTEAVLIHISTDFVFDGSKADAWQECDPMNPLSVYGASKAAGEEAVRDGLERHLILRTAWVFSTYGTNFVKTMLRLGRTRDEVRVVSDQSGSPTGAEDIAQALAGVAQRTLSEEEPELWGTYHFACRGSTTWHGLAELVFATAEARWGRRPTVTAISTADYPTAARRPQNSVLDCTHFDATFALDRRQWQTSVRETVAQLLTEDGALAEML